MYFIFLFYLYQLDEIIVKYTNEAPEKTKEECCPGAPYMSFSKKTTVSIHIVNPQSSCGLFELSISISQADTASTIVSRIMKKYKHIKGIYHYFENYFWMTCKSINDNVSIDGSCNVSIDLLFIT